MPSIRNDLPAPMTRKIYDRVNYGDGGAAWSLISPSVFSHHGVYERDILKPRSKLEVKRILSNVGYDLTDDVFEATWNTAKSQNPYGEVSIEEFRSALNEFGANKFQKQEIVCN